MPKILLEAVDRIAGRRKRSWFIAEATREKLERERFLKALDKTFGAWTDERHPELKTNEDVDKYLDSLREFCSERMERIYCEQVSH